MAARKSCTHLTWAEAKGKVGGDSKKGTGLPTAKKDSHGKMLAAKIMAKNDTRSEFDQVRDRQAARQARRDQERQTQLDQERERQKEQQRLDAIVKPYDQAQQKLTEVAAKLQEESASVIDWDSLAKEKANWSMIVECKQLQLDEIMALQAIFMDTDTLAIADSCQITQLQEAVEHWQMGDLEDEALLKPIVQHDPLSFTLRLSMESDKPDEVALLLLKCTCPPDYPLQTTPTFEIPWYVITDKTLVVSSNKPLETLGFLSENDLLQALSAYSQEELLGMPCIYEIASTWLSEHFFDFVTASPSATT